jgi:glutamate-1-semialdehyde 2,1-aminomutase
VAAGSGLATFGTASSAGVPEAFTACTRVLPLDDEQALRDLFKREGADIAAVIIEPVPANHGLLLQRPVFLNLLRDETRKHGALLIFDEVISGFRIARGGAAEYYGITPDMATFGKIIGGGMPVGAFGASTAIMSRLAPDGDTYQAGTLSGNPVAMAAGLATLDVLEREAAWGKLEERGARLEQLLAPVVGNAGFPLHLVRLGSLLWLSLHEQRTVRKAGTLLPAAAERFKRLFHAMLAHGIYIAPSAYEVTFVSLAHSADDLQRFASSLAAAVAESA